MKKTPCLGKVSEDFGKKWKAVLNKAELQLVRILYEEAVKLKREWQETYYSKLQFETTGEDEDFVETLRILIKEKAMKMKQDLKLCR